MERSNITAKIIEDKTHMQNITIPHRTEFYFHAWFGALERVSSITIIKLMRYD